MTKVIRPLLPIWLALLVLFGVELGAAFLPLGHALAGLILLPAAAMVALVGFGFMRLRRFGAITHIFALAAVFWLVVLLGLGSMDPFTRTEYPVRVTTYP